MVTVSNNYGGVNGDQNKCNDNPQLDFGHESRT